MIKNLICIILSLGILFQALDKAIIILNYQINKDYYAKFLCVNRDKPQMHCNGKCCMCKQLEKAQKKESSPAFPAKDKMETVWFNKSADNFSFKPEATLLTLCKHIFDRDLLPDIYLGSVFHPPKSC